MSIRDEFEKEILVTLPTSILAEIEDLFPDVPVRQVVAILAKHGLRTYQITHPFFMNRRKQSTGMHDP